MFVAKYTTQFLIAAAVIYAVAFGVVFSLGLPLGIDFTGGSLTEVAYDVRPEKSALESELSEFELGAFSLRETVNEVDKDGYILRTRDLTEPERLSVEEVLVTAGENGELGRFTSIGPTIGEELKDKAVWAIGAVVLIIILYVAFAFRGVSKPVGSWVYGGITILALIHDVIIPTAVMAVLGYLFGAEADILFVMALLAVLGYSVNDTIVVFDRVRENLIKYRQEKKVKVKEAGVMSETIEYIFNKPFDEVVGMSVSQTLVRSMNTSITTLVALGALYFLGGEVTRNFALILIAGVLAGTYSSICIANPLLIWVASRQTKKEES